MLDPWVIPAAVGFAAGLLFGGLLMWLAQRPRATAAAATTREQETRLAEQQSELALLREELNQLRTELDARQARLADSAGKVAQLEALLGERDQRLSEVLLQTREMDAAASELRAALSERGERIGRLETQLDEERRAAREKLALMEKAEQQLTRQFEQLAGKALNESREAFLALANENFTKHQEDAQGKLVERQTAIGQVVQGLREQLDRYDKHLKTVEGERATMQGKLAEQIQTLKHAHESLRDETGNLVRALRRPQVRGSWGEATLRRVVEMAGMVERCDFEEQFSTQGEDGVLRPDMIVHVPGGGALVVDSKAPLKPYLDAHEAADDESRRVALERFATGVHDHMNQLSRKAYWTQFEQAPDFVVMFLPGEHFLSAALMTRPDLLERGFEKRVVLATPTTLVSLLRTVAMGWREEQLAENAAQVSALGTELYERLSVLADYLGKLRRHIAGTVDEYNALVGSLEGRVLPSARRFPLLGIQSKKELPAQLDTIQSVPRRLTADELTRDDSSGNPAAQDGEA